LDPAGSVLRRRAVVVGNDDAPKGELGEHRATRPVAPDQMLQGSSAYSHAEIEDGHGLVASPTASINRPHLRWCVDADRVIEAVGDETVAELD